MAVNMKNIEEVLESELRISEHEAKLFVLIVYKGKVNTEMISKMLHWSIDEADRVAKSLVNRGMIIDITKSEYESLHPRFAIVNRYRKRCLEENIIFRRNVSVDNIAIFLEGPYDDPKTK